MRDDIRPTLVRRDDGGDGVPYCSEKRCPSFDGTRCGIMGVRPSRHCEPAIASMAELIRLLEDVADKANDACGGLDIGASVDVVMNRNEVVEGVPRSASVDHPDHYGGKDNVYEAIKVIEAWGLGFCLGNVVKYIARAEKKGAPIDDLKKARWYLDREIARREGGK